MPPITWNLSQISDTGQYLSGGGIGRCQFSYVMLYSCRQIPGSETIYVDGTKVARSDYAVNQETGVVALNTAPADGEDVEAEYTYYVIAEVTLVVGNAAGTRPINKAPGDLIVTYIVAVNTSTYGLVGGEQFSLQVKPGRGAAITLNQHIPVGMERAMVLH